MMLNLLEFLNGCVTGATQDCDLTNNLKPNNFQPINVNLSDTSCFTCTDVARAFFINDVMVTPSPGVQIMNGITLVISNWTAYPIDLSNQNRVRCNQDRDNLPRTTFFYTLTPGLLTLSRNELFYVEGGSSISVLCVNPNQQPFFSGQDQRWFNSEGVMVSTDRTLTLLSVRANAGTYTCSISAVYPDIPVVTFEVVIRYAPGVLTNSQLPTQIHVGATLVLECYSMAIPLPNVMWTRNLSAVDSDINSNIIITSVFNGSRIRSTLTWANVPLNARGTYHCLFENVVGSGNGSYIINVDFHDPVIAVHPACGPYAPGTNITLTCASSDIHHPIWWTKQNDSTIESSVFMTGGTYFINIFTIRNVQADNSGTYICSVGSSKSEVEIEVFIASTNVISFTSSSVIPVTSGSATPVTSSSIIPVLIVISVAIIIIIMIVIINSLLCFYCRRNKEVVKFRNRIAEEEDAVYESVSLDKQNVDEEYNIVNDPETSNSNIHPKPVVVGDIEMQTCTAYVARKVDRSAELLDTCVTYGEIVA